MLEDYLNQQTTITFTEDFSDYTKDVDAVVSIYLTNTATKAVAEATINVVEMPFKLVFFKTDHLGSPRMVTDHDGTILTTHDFLAYGEELTDPDFNTNRMKFTGHERDPETGLDYMKARYYAAGFGRMLQVDPVDDYDFTDPMSFNKYSYVRGNPIVLLDPTGMKVDWSKIKNLKLRWKLKNAWKTLKKNGSDATKYIMNELETSPITHFVELRPEDDGGNHVEATSLSDQVKNVEGQPASSTLVIQYAEPHMVDGKNGKVPTTLDVTMSHEIKHMYDYDKGIHTTDDVEEANAVKVEDTYRALIPGMPLRERYNSRLFNGSKAWEGPINFNHQRDWDFIPHRKKGNELSNRELYKKYGRLPW